MAPCFAREDLFKRARVYPVLIAQSGIAQVLSDVGEQLVSLAFRTSDVNHIHVEQLRLWQVLTARGEFGAAL
jgi:hypothetical protein